MGGPGSGRRKGGIRNKKGELVKGAYTGKRKLQKTGIMNKGRGNSIYVKVNKDGTARTW